MATFELVEVVSWSNNMRLSVRCIANYLILRESQLGLLQPSLRINASSSPFSSSTNTFFKIPKQVRGQDDQRYDGNDILVSDGYGSSPNGTLCEQRQGT